MLEIGIVICLALSLFLALRRFPQAVVEEELVEASTFVDTTPTAILPKTKPSFKFNIGGFLSKFGHKERAEDIESAIKSGQEAIVAPSEINQARVDYDEEDPEVAKLIYESEKCLLEEDYRKAEDLALEALSKDKKSSQAYAVMGKIALSKNAMSDAREAFQASLKCNDENGDAYFGLGQICIKQENYTTGIENLQKAANLDRNNPLWYAELGKAYMQVRQFAKAAKALKRAASLDIDNREYKELANELENKQRMHSSVYRFKK